MKSSQLRKAHIEAFSKLSISERLSWALGQGRFLAGFMDAKARKINKFLRRNGKKYFKGTNLG